MTRMPLGLTTLLPGFVALIPAVATAQETLKVEPSKDKVLEYKIVASSEITTSTTRKVNGEERAGRGGGQGPVKSTQTVVFEQGPAGSGWRNYQIAEASVSRSGRGGEPQTNKIVGALHGKKVKIEKQERRVVFTVDGGEALPAPVTAGIPEEFDINALLPKKAIAVDGEFQLKRGLANALRTLMHPVRPQPAARGEGDGAGQGRQRGGQGGGQRGRRGGGQGAAASAWFAGPGMRILGSRKTEVSGVGKLVSVEEKDGRKLATVAIKGEITGSGTPGELGLTQQQRRRRAGGGGEAAGQEGTGEVKCTIDATIVIDQTAQQLVSMHVRGKVATKSTTTRANNRNGEEQKVETDQKTDGSFDIALTCAAKSAQSPAPAGDAGK